MASPEAVRQALIQRVSRKVSGHGVTRRSNEGAVDRVLGASLSVLDDRDARQVTA